MLNEIKQIVRDAGEIMLKAEHIEDAVKSKEGNANFVTKYDVAVQNYLFEHLAAVFPKAVFIGEEDAKHENTNHESCFIIDPIDGTTNFIMNLKHSAISVAYLEHGEVIMGVVYNPYLNELFTAERGMGAYLNDKRLRINDKSMKEGIVGIGTSPYYADKTDESFAMARNLFDQSLDIRRSGAATLDLCDVAANRYVLFYEALLSPWDYAAGSLIIEEAGGVVKTMDNQKLQFDNPCSVIAANPVAFKEFFR